MAEPLPPAWPATRAPASPWRLFVVFNRMAMQGFGGVLPVAQRELVEVEGWLTREQFVDLLALSQVLPGPNVINLSVIFGDRHFGWRGSVAATAGLVAAPLVIVLLLAAAYARWRDVPAVAGALRGMAAVAAGLLLATGCKLAVTLRTSPLGRPLAYGLAGAALLLVGGLRWPMVAAVAVLGGAGMAWAAWRLRGERRNG
ncbi:MAG: chromate transporter [Aquabacterium sp.]